MCVLSAPARAAGIELGISHVLGVIQHSLPIDSKCTIIEHAIFEISSEVI